MFTEAFKGFKSRVSHNSLGFAVEKSSGCPHAATPNDHFVVFGVKKPDDSIDLLRLPVAETDSVFLKILAASHEIKGSEGVTERQVLAYRISLDLGAGVAVQIQEYPAVHVVGLKYS